MADPPPQTGPLDKAALDAGVNGGKDGIRGAPIAALEQKFDPPHEAISRRMTVYAVMPEGIGILMEVFDKGEQFDKWWDCPQHPEERPDMGGCPDDCARFVFTPEQAKQRYSFLAEVIDQVSGGVPGVQHG